MPLSFQRPYSSLFSGQRYVNNSYIEETIPEQPTVLHDFLRFYPLSAEREARRGAQPVMPLQPRTNHQPNSQLAQFFTQKPQSLPQRGPSHHVPARRPDAEGGIREANVLTPRQHLPQPSQSIQPLQMPSAPPSPQTAADHFRNINKNLPDGVMYEPLDDDIMRLLKENGHIKTEPSVPSVEQTAPSPALSSTPQPPTTNVELNAIISTLINLAQDEQNANIFYSGMARSAPTDEIKKTLHNLATGCETRREKYTQILKANFNQDFTPEAKIINTALPFNSAISLAISEENKALTTLGNLLDQVQDTSLEQQIERIISKKVIAHQILLSFNR